MKKFCLLFFLSITEYIWALDFVGILLPGEMWNEKFYIYNENDSSVQSLVKSMNNAYLYNDRVRSTLLDSNIFIYENYDIGDEKMVEFYTFPKATHSLYEAIQTEFRIYREINYLNISKEELEEMFSAIEEILVPELKKEKSEARIFYYAKKADSTIALMETCQGDGSLWCFDGYYTEFIDSYSKTQPLPYRMDFAARLRAENGSLIVPADLEGRTFSLFRLNGSVLRKGELRNNMPLPHEPAILRVEGFGDMYLK